VLQWHSIANRAVTPVFVWRGYVEQQRKSVTIAVSQPRLEASTSENKHRRYKDTISNNFILDIILPSQETEHLKLTQQKNLTHLHNQKHVK
jgi:hypothetical protein